MSDVPHVPALRLGKAYESLDQLEVKDHRTGELKARVSQVKGRIIRKDLAKLAVSRAALKQIDSAELLQICARAGDFHLNGDLPIGHQGHKPSAPDYIE